MKTKEEVKINNIEIQLFNRIYYIFFNNLDETIKPSLSKAQNFNFFIKNNLTIAKKYGIN